MAGRIPQAFIDDLVSRSDIVEVISDYVQVKKQGRDYKACCPFHQEKTPSFHINPVKQLYHCFGCGVGGSVITFLMEYERMSFIEALEDLAKRAGISLPQDTSPYQHQTPEVDYHALLASAVRAYQQQWKKLPRAKVAAQYLKDRGISGETAKRFALGFAPASWDFIRGSNNKVAAKHWVGCGLLIEKENGGYYDRFRDRIMFPIRDRRGRVIGFGGRLIEKGEPKYLNSPETAVFHKRQALYGLYEALQVTRNLDNILIVEGYMDVVALAEHGIHNAVATLGTATSSDHIKQLQRHAQTLIFCFDGDEAGKKAAWHALITALPLLNTATSLRFLFLPTGEDPDSLVRQIGADAFRERLQDALSLNQFFFSHLREALSLTAADDQASLLNKALPLIAEIREPSIQLTFCEALARLAHVTPESVKQLLQNQPQAKSEDNAQPLRAPVQPSLQRTFCLILLHAPTLYRDLKSAMPKQVELVKQHYPFLAKMISVIEQLTEPSTALILEHFRDTQTAASLQKLATQKLLIPETGYLSELKGACTRLCGHVHKREIDGLLLKAKGEGLNEAEHALLQRLLQSQDI